MIHLLDLSSLHFAAKIWREENYNNSLVHISCPKEIDGICRKKSWVVEGGKHHHIPKRYFDYGVSCTNELGMKKVTQSGPKNSQLLLMCNNVPTNQFLWKLWTLDSKMKLSCSNTASNFWLKVPISIIMENTFIIPIIMTKQLA